jgi:cytochrome c oxidase assembly factor CtaG
MFDGFALSWSWSPGVFIVLLALFLLYVLGLRRVHLLHALNPQEPVVTTLQMLSFFVGLFMVALLLLSPVDTIARTQLFTVHMLQAVMITTVCVPLLLAGCPAVLLRPIVGVPVLRGILRFLAAPLVASLVFNLVFLCWHIPRLYNYAMTDAALYHTMMLSIFLAALLNWWPIIGSLKELRPTSYPIQMLYVIFDGQPVEIFAFILVFSGIPLYTHYAIPVQLHLASFGDQAIGGALLLIPGLVDIVIMAPLFFHWFGQIEQSARVADLKRVQEEEYDEEEDILEEERTEAQ